MTDAALYKIALWLAIEDYSGLWELLWELRTREPQANHERQAQKAAATMRELIRLGWIDLYYCREPYGQLTKVLETDALSVLNEGSAWEEPKEDAVSVRMGATEKGEDAYRST